MTTNLAASREEVQRSFHRLIQWVLGNIYPLADNSIDIVSVLKSVDSCETLDELLEVYRDLLLELNNTLRKKKAVCPEIAKAIKFVEQNYHHDISVQQVAEYVNLSPNYLSSLFKKEMQVNFTEFLNEYRVEKARKLLLETYLKAYEIAEKVGFNDNTYFSRVFKKVTGSNPNEFRKQWLKGWTEDLEDENVNKG